MSARRPVRRGVIRQVAESLLTLRCDGVLRVGVDGIDGAGKTVFADELAQEITRMGRPVIRAGVDGFHQPRAVRHQRGRDSPEGYFLDSYDYPTLRRVLLDPLSHDGSYRRAVFDHVTDRPVRTPAEQPHPRAILIFDGIFLHRPELAGYWHYSVFLDVPFDVAVARMAHRDATDPDPDALSNQRYVQGQTLYLTSCSPATAASVVIDNTDLDNPLIRQT